MQNIEDKSQETNSTEFNLEDLLDDEAEDKEENLDDQLEDANEYPSTEFGEQSLSASFDLELDELLEEISIAHLEIFEIREEAKKMFMEAKELLADFKEMVLVIPSHSQMEVAKSTPVTPKFQKEHGMVTLEAVSEEVVSHSESDPELVLDHEPESKIEMAVEQQKIVTNPPKINMHKKMQSSVIARIFKSWSIFKDLGTVGSGKNSAHKFRLIDTDYVMYIPLAASYTWQVRWAKDCFEDISSVKRIKINREVSMREVFSNVGPEIQRIFTENQHLFVKS